jgi:hypothetical protein
VATLQHITVTIRAFHIGTAIQTLFADLSVPGQIIPAIICNQASLTVDCLLHGLVVFLDLLKSKKRTHLRLICLAADVLLGCIRQMPVTLHVFFVTKEIVCALVGIPR